MTFMEFRGAALEPPLRTEVEAEWVYIKNHSDVALRLIEPCRDIRDSMGREIAHINGDLFWNGQLLGNFCDRSVVLAPEEVVRARIDIHIESGLATGTYPFQVVFGAVSLTEAPLTLPDVHFLYSWGSPGSGDGEFSTPMGIAVGSPVYVADHGKARIQVFDADGNFLHRWGTPGSGDGQFSGGRAIAIGESGYVYVAESGNNRVQVFDADGNFLRKWGTPGDGDGQLLGPDGIVGG